MTHLSKVDTATSAYPNIAGHGRQQAQPQRVHEDREASKTAPSTSANEASSLAAMVRKYPGLKQHLAAAEAGQTKVTNQSLSQLKIDPFEACDILAALIGSKACDPYPNAVDSVSYKVKRADAAAVTAVRPAGLTPPNPVNAASTQAPTASPIHVATELPIVDLSAPRVLVGNLRQALGASESLDPLATKHWTLCIAAAKRERHALRKLVDKPLNDGKTALERVLAAGDWTSLHVLVQALGNGVFHGVLKHTYANGDRYVGAWSNGYKSGQGEQTYANGDRYVGAWSNNQRSGQGEQTWADGCRYVGGWKYGARSGQGEQTWADGCRYVGGWRYGAKAGQGEYTLANGDRLVGGWSNGLWLGH